MLSKHDLISKGYFSKLEETRRRGHQRIRFVGLVGKDAEEQGIPDWRVTIRLVESNLEAGLSGMIVSIVVNR